MTQPPVTRGYNSVAGRLAAPINWQRYESPFANAEQKMMGSRTVGLDGSGSFFINKSAQEQMTNLITAVQKTNSPADTGSYTVLIWCIFEITLTKPLKKKTQIHKISCVLFGRFAPKLEKTIAPIINAY